jgi:hypothetical protein
MPKKTMEMQHLHSVTNVNGIQQKAMKEFEDSVEWNGRIEIADNSLVEECESNEESNPTSDHDKVDLVDPLSELFKIPENARS